MGKRGKKFIWNGIEFDSPDETFFAMWLQELLEAEFILAWERCTKSFEVTEGVKNAFKEGSKEKTQTILQNLEYTPDFEVYWSIKSDSVFYGVLGNGRKIVEPFISDHKMSVVEVKPNFDKNNMTRLFRQVQKFLYKTRKLYVNQVIIEKLFGETFTPREYLLTKTGKERKITKWKVKSLEDFLNGNRISKR